MLPPPRLVTLVLVTPDGGLVGALRPIVVETPWWQEAGPVVRAIRERDGIDVTILRLLEASSTQPPGGAVSYLAEVERPVPAGPWSGRLEDDPRRQTWARPGGPAADIRWADAVLAEYGMSRTGPAEQVRSWNLSSLWRLPVRDQVAWLKVVPPFFAHERPLIAALEGHPVPRLLAGDGPRMLLAEIPGEDLYAATGDQLRTMIGVLVAIQRSTTDRLDALLRLGLPDWRPPALQDAIADLIDRIAADLETPDRATLARFVGDLPARLASIGACGLPDTLVHGDFHPGNTRGAGRSITLLDWGDGGIGHPLLDQSAFLDRVPRSDVAGIRRHWHASWERAVPGSTPDRAADLLAPVAAARQAVIYQRFLDAIEPSEWPYHATDPATWMRRTADLVRAER